MHDDIRIVPVSDDLVDGFHDAVDTVARERRWLALVEGVNLSESRAFVQRILDGGGAQFLAVDDGGDVVGWCDVVRNGLPGFGHVGHLGMGLLRHVRGRGIGRRLAETTIVAARAMGMQRIELEVFASNTAARALYERLGFVVEGVKRDVRYLDGKYDDIVIMAQYPSP